MASDADHTEFHKTMEAGFAQLKAWLEIRLEQQDGLLRSISHDCKLLSSAGSLAGTFSFDRTRYSDTVENKAPAIANQNETLRRAGCPSKIHCPSAKVENNDCAIADQTEKQDERRPSEASLEILEPPLPGTILEASKDLPNQLHEAPACISPRPASESRSDSKKHGKELGGTSADDQNSLQAAAAASMKGQDWQITLMDVFDQLDSDQSGSINFTELIEAFKMAGMPEADVYKVFQADTSGNGQIDRVEWLHLIEEAAQAENDEFGVLVEFLQRITLLQDTKGSLFGSNRSRKPCLILRHDSLWRMLWDLTLCALLFYVSISVPFTLGFGENKTLEDIGLAVDIFFCCDVVLNFRTSFMDKEGVLIYDSKRIACKYLRSWFLIDIISSFPFDFISDGLLPNLTPARLLKIGKIAKVMKLLRISRSISAVTESELIESVDHFLTGRCYQTYARLVKLVVVMFVVAHWLACFGSAIDSSSIDAYFADATKPPSELMKYLAGMYWSMTTLSTVGYGDITPKTDEERAYSIVAMVIGGALYGYVVGSVTSLVTDMDVKTHTYHKDMEFVNSWLDSRYFIPRELRRRLRNYFKHTYAAKAVMEDYAVVSDLSPELRADIAYFLIHDRVKQHPMFVKNPNSTLAKLVEVLRKNHVGAYERVVKVGDPGTAMYILVDGLARYEHGVEWFPQGMRLSGRAERFQQLSKGESFGEEIIFHLAETYTYTIVALKVCDFHSISEDDFKSKYKNMPELREHMHQAFIESKRERAKMVAERVSVYAESSAPAQVQKSHLTRATCA